MQKGESQSKKRYRSKFDQWCRFQTVKKAGELGNMTLADFAGDDSDGEGFDVGLQSNLEKKVENIENIVYKVTQTIGVLWPTEMYIESTGETPKPWQLRKAQDVQGRWVDGVIRPSAFGCPDGCLQLSAERNTSLAKSREMDHSRTHFTKNSKRTDDVFNKDSKLMALDTKFHELGGNDGHEAPVITVDKSNKRKLKQFDPDDFLTGFAGSTTFVKPNEAPKEKSGEASASSNSKPPKKPSSSAGGNAGSATTTSLGGAGGATTPAVPTVKASASEGKIAQQCSDMSVVNMEMDKVIQAKRHSTPSGEQRLLRYTKT